MIVLSHRGYWKVPEEKNTAIAFRRSFDLGFGTETDVRDLSGELVISHDPPTGGELRFSEFLDLLNGRDLPLALNIKSDGLAVPIRDELVKRSLSKWFVFDMSVPDTLQHLKIGNPVYLRRSEFEFDNSLTDRSDGIWLDAFEGEWWSPDLVHDYLLRGKKVCIVSSELHGRDPNTLWNTLKSSNLWKYDQVLLCTDRPEQALSHFTGGAYDSRSRI
jgi:hypothetical protein